MGNAASAAMPNVFREKYPEALRKAVAHASRLYELLKKLETRSPPPALVGRAGELRVLVGEVRRDLRQGRGGEPEAVEAIAGHVQELHRTVRAALGTGRRLECCQGDDVAGSDATTTVGLSLAVSVALGAATTGVASPTERRDWGDRPEVLERFHAELDLVDQEARALAKRLPSFRASFEELRAWGLEGLLEEARRFDPDRGILFVRCARRGIRTSMLNGLRAASGSPRDPNRVAAAHADPTPVVSPEKLLGDAEELALLPALLEALPSEERSLLERCYVRGESLAQAATALGLAASTASRMHGRALASLRRQLRPGDTA